MLHTLAVIAAVMGIAWFFRKDPGLFLRTAAALLVMFVVLSVAGYLALVYSGSRNVPDRVVDCRVDPDDPVLWRRDPIVGCPGTPTRPPRLTEWDQDADKAIPSCGTSPFMMTVPRGDPRICY